MSSGITRQGNFVSSKTQNILLKTNEVELSSQLFKSNTSHYYRSDNADK